MAAAALVGPLLAGPARADVYRWVDEQGTIHFASGLERVPERFRAAAQRLAGPAAPGSGEAAASGTARIDFTPGAPILVSARINGAGPVTLVLDTGADRTLIAPAALRALGVLSAGGARTEVRGVTGAAEATLVPVALVEVAGARVGPLTIVAHDAGIPTAQGLLGRDFLDRFRVVIDARAGRVTLAPP